MVLMNKNHISRNTGIVRVQFQHSLNSDGVEIRLPQCLYFCLCVQLSTDKLLSMECCKGLTFHVGGTGGSVLACKCTKLLDTISWKVLALMLLGCTYVNRFMPATFNILESLSTEDFSPLKSRAKGCLWRPKKKNWANGVEEKYPCHLYRHSSCSADFPLEPSSLRGEQRTY